VLCMPCSLRDACSPELTCLPLPGRPSWMPPSPRARARCGCCSGLPRPSRRSAAWIWCVL
jgi:hypothetical protein